MLLLSQDRVMEKKPKSDFVGIAGLFEASQIKKYFINYVYFMVGVEVLILWLTFLGNMGSQFPVKFYFLMAFSIPLALSCSFIFRCLSVWFWIHFVKKNWKSHRVLKLKE